MQESTKFTIKIAIGMLLGIIVGLIVQWLSIPTPIREFIINYIFRLGGEIFLNLIKLLVVPIVLVSLVTGVASIGDPKKLGKIGGKSLLLYLLTTGIAVIIALFFATLFDVGKGLSLPEPANFVPPEPVSLYSVFVDIFPQNPFTSLAEGNLLQVIVFSILFGAAIALSGEAGQRVTNVFQSFNTVLLRLILMIIRLSPYGVFLLLASLFSRISISAIGHIAGYFLVVLGVLIIQLLASYSVMLFILARLNPITFFKKMYTAMIFAFSVSSSSASIPVVMRTTEFRLGVKNSIASFVIPLGSTINMDGTVIMQAIATVFIAHAYNLSLGFSGYLMVICLATLASIGTAGVPSAGILILAMVLQQLGLPVEGIALIIGVDRFLDMARTAVNISGDSMIACIVGKSEKAFDEKIYNDRAL